LAACSIRSVVHLPSVTLTRGPCCQVRLSISPSHSTHRSSLIQSSVPLWWFGCHLLRLPVRRLIPALFPQSPLLAFPLSTLRYGFHSPPACVDLKSIVSSSLPQRLANERGASLNTLASKLISFLASLRAWLPDGPTNLRGSKSRSSAASCCLYLQPLSLIC